jgi:hypothetical protein
VSASIVSIAVGVTSLTIFSSSRRIVDSVCSPLARVPNGLGDESNIHLARILRSQARGFSIPCGLPGVEVAEDSVAGSIATTPPVSAAAIPPPST